MPKIEIGRNEKGEFAILKVMTSRTACFTQTGLEDYKSIGIPIDVPSGYEVNPGKVKKEYLLKMLSEQESNIKKIKELLV